ncbi:MAG: multi-sensor hybrid histidine kinase [Bacteroidota bacterium]
MDSQDLTQLDKEALIQKVLTLQKHIEENELHIRAMRSDIRNKELIELLEANSHDLLLVHDLKGEIIAFNRASDEYIAPSTTNIRDFLAPAFRNDFDEYLRNITENKFNKGFMRVIDKNGTIRLLNYSNRLVEDSNGEKIVHCIGHDITEIWLANKKLKSSESSYRGIFNHSSDAIFILNIDGQVLDLNETAIGLYGVDKEEVLNKYFLDINYIKYPFEKELNFDIKQVLNSAWEGNIEVIEWDIVDKDFGRFTHEITFRKAIYFNQEIIIAHDRDITKRKLEDEQKLKKISVAESQKKLEEIFEKVRMLAVTIDNSCKITYCNTNFLNLTGFKKSEVLGQDLFDLFVPENGLENQRTEFLDITHGGMFLEQFERQLFSKYGDNRIIQFNVAMIADADGEISGFSLVGKDVSENKRMVRALRDTNKKLEDFMQNANDLIQLFTVEGKFTFVNQTWKETLGYSDEEIENLRFSDIISVDHKHATLSTLHKILHGEIIPEFETVLQTKEGKNVYVSCSVNCRIVNGTATEFRGIFHNNTSRIRAERAQTLFYSIANLAVKSDNLESLYLDIHKLLKQYIDVNNFHVALIDNEHQQLNFPYYVDENNPGVISSSHRIVGKGLSEYTLKQGKALFLYEEDILKLSENNEIELIGRLPKIWMGVPLRLENKIIGAIAVKSYSDKNKYKQRHLEMLDFVSSQIALAIDRKIKEAKIADQTSRLRSIFESSSHLIWSVNQKIELTSFNQNYADAIYFHHGVNLFTDNIQQEQKLIISDESFRDFVFEKYRLAFQGIPQHYETYISDKQNKNIQIWRETYLNPIISSEGKIEEVSGISHDITEKKNAELAIQEREEKFRSIFESFQDIYYQTDSLGRITLISPSVYELTGYTPQEMIGKKISDYYVNAKKQEKLLKQLLRTGSVRNFEVRIRRKDGSEIQTISNIRVVFNNKREAIATEGVARDITFLKKTEQDLINAKEIAEKSLKVKELFLANMSHEIRTPMNGIIGMIDILDMSPLDANQKDYVNTIKRSSETLLNILNDILDLSKIEAGKMQLKPQPIYLQNTLDKLIGLFSQQAKNKGIELIFKIEEDVPLYVVADETRLIQILANLTSNAIKFTDKGSVTIQVEKQKSSVKNKCLLKASIIDTGIGIAKENLALLFNTFSQIDNSSTKSFSGTGLGLVISKQLCEMMNGTIGVKSKVNHGSSFWFTFLVPTCEPFEIPQQNKVNIHQDVNLNGVAILVVDDNSVNRKVASEILKSYHCSVDLATNGIEAIDKVKANNYQLILMDIQMPVMDGVTAMQEIRSTIKNKIIPPIIAMTAYSMKDDKLKFIDAGMDDYISKPIRPESLISKIVEWLPESIKNIDSINDESSVIKLENIVPNSDLPIIDEEVRAQLMKYGGIELLQDMWNDFIEESNVLITQSLHAFEVSDFQQLRSHIHTIKGSAGTLGLLQITEISTILDSKLKIMDYSDLESNLNLLVQRFESFVEFVNIEKCFG